MGTELAEDMNGQVSEYPGEDPTELEHKKAMEYLERGLRSKDLLSFTVASPTKTAEYTGNPELTEPPGASDPVKASITVKNAEIIAKNAIRHAQWLEHVHKQTDQIAVLLESYMLNKAPYRMRAMKTTHARNDGTARVDGGAWYRALVALKGTLPLPPDIASVPGMGKHSVSVL